LTDTPGLPREHYAVLLSVLADDVASGGFRLADTSKRVRDACQAAGVPVGRATTAFVIKGLLFAGVRFDRDPPPDARTIASQWADHVIGLCRGARMELTEGDVAAIRDWVSGGLAS